MVAQARHGRRGAPRLELVLAACCVPALLARGAAAAVFTGESGPPWSLRFGRDCTNATSCERLHPAHWDRPTCLARVLARQRYEPRFAETYGSDGRWFMAREEDGTLANTSEEMTLTLAGCDEFCGEGTWYWDAGPRLTTWIVPVVLLLSNIELSPIDKRRFMTVVHAVGDPIDSFWSLLHKIYVWRRLHAIGLARCEDRRVGADELPPTSRREETFGRWLRWWHRLARRWAHFLRRVAARIRRWRGKEQPGPYRESLLLSAAARIRRFRGKRPELPLAPKCVDSGNEGDGNGKEKSRAKGKGKCKGKAKGKGKSKENSRESARDQAEGRPDGSDDGMVLPVLTPEGRQAPAGPGNESPADDREKAAKDPLEKEADEDALEDEEEYETPHDRARVIATVLAGFEEISGAYIKSEMYYGMILDRLGNIGDADVQSAAAWAEWRHCARMLADDRTNEFLRTLIAIFVYIFGVASALDEDLGGGNTSKPGGRIGSAVFLMWLVPLALLSNVVGTFTSRRTCLTAMRLFVQNATAAARRDEEGRAVRLRDESPGGGRRAGGPAGGREVDEGPRQLGGGGWRSPVWGPEERRELLPITSWRVYFDSQHWLGAVYTYRPWKLSYRSIRSQSSQAHYAPNLLLYALALIPVLVSAVGAFVIIWYAVPEGWSCRHVWVVGLTFNWIASNAFTVWLHNDRLESREAKKKREEKEESERRAEKKAREGKEERKRKEQREDAIHRGGGLLFPQQGGSDDASGSGTQVNGKDDDDGAEKEKGESEEKSKSWRSWLGRCLDWLVHHLWELPSRVVMSWVLRPAGRSLRWTWTRTADALHCWVLRRRLVRRLLGPGTWTERTRWRVVLAKDFVVGAGALGLVFASTSGAFNNCYCWSAVMWHQTLAGDRGARAFVPLVTEARYQAAADGVYDRVVYACLGAQLVYLFAVVAAWWPGISVVRWNETRRRREWRHEVLVQRGGGGRDECGRRAGGGEAQAEVGGEAAKDKGQSWADVTYDDPSYLLFWYLESEYKAQESQRIARMNTFAERMETEQEDWEQRKRRMSIIPHRQSGVKKTTTISVEEGRYSQ